MTARVWLATVLAASVAGSALATVEVGRGAGDGAAVASRESSCGTESVPERRAKAAKDTRSVEELIAATRDPVWRERWKAVNELGVRRDARATEALVDRALRDENPHPRWRSVWAVASVDPGGKSAIPLMLKGLDSEDPTVVRNAAVALSIYEHAAARPELLRGLRDEDAFRRWEAVFCLRRIADPDIGKALIPMADPAVEPTVRVRNEVALVLGRIDGDEARKALIEILGADPSPEVRWRAAMSLANRGDPSVVGDLQAALTTETDAEVRTHLERGIARFRRRSPK